MKSLLRILSWSFISLYADSTTASAQGWPSSFVSTGQPSPSSPVELWGHERLTWDQDASDSEILSSLSFIAYVDGFIDPLEDVRCSPVRNESGFECSSRLPRMAPGPHSIELTAIDPSNLTSERSAPLMVVLRVASTGGARTSAARVGAGVGAERLVDALTGVADIAVLPDRTVLIGEGTGRVIAARPGKTSATAFDLRTLDRSGAEIQLLALAVAPDFDRSHAVFVAYATPRGLRLARFTEADGVLTNHAILREGLPIALSPPTAALAIGPDNKIYLATSDRVLRFNMDGSTPVDGSDSGLFSTGVQRPEKLAWSHEQRVLWLLGSTPKGSELRAIALGDDGRGRALNAYDLGRLNVTSLAILPGSSSERRMIMTSSTSNDLLDWRVAAGVIDQGRWFAATGLEESAAIDTRDGDLWIASRSGVFRIEVPRR